MRSARFMALLAVAASAGCGSPPPTGSPSAEPHATGESYEEILDRLEVEMGMSGPQRKILAESFRARGISEFRELNFEVSRDLFQRACDLDPADSVSRTWLERTREQLIAHVPGYDRELVSLLCSRVRPLGEARDEIRKHFAMGKALRDEGELERSSYEFQAVIEQIQWFPWNEEFEGIGESAAFELEQLRILRTGDGRR